MPQSERNREKNKSDGTQSGEQNPGSRSCGGIYLVQHHQLGVNPNSLAVMDWKVLAIVRRRVEVINFRPHETIANVSCCSTNVFIVTRLSHKECEPSPIRFFISQIVEIENWQR